MSLKSLFTVCPLPAALFAIFTLAAGAQTPIPPAGQPVDPAVQRDWEQSLDFEVRAIGSVGEVPVAMIDVNGEPSVVKERSRLAIATVKSISESKGQVVLEIPGQIDRVLPFNHPEDITFPTLTPDEVDALITPKKTGLMEISSYDLSPELKRTWKTLSREKREEILLRNLKAGMVLSYVNAPGGLTGFAGPLFGDLAMKRRGENRAAFMASLNPTQQEIMSRTRQPLFTSDDLRLDPEGVKRRVAEAKLKADAAMKELKKSLTEEQQKLYERAGF